MTLDVLLVDSERRRHRVLHRLWILRSRVNYNLAVFELSDRRGRLHRRVRKVRNVVLSLVRLATFGKLSVHVADVAGDFLRLAYGFKQRLLE